MTPLMLAYKKGDYASMFILLQARGITGASAAWMYEKIGVAVEEERLEAVRSAKKG